MTGERLDIVLIFLAIKYTSFGVIIDLISIDPLSADWYKLYQKSEKLIPLQIFENINARFYFH